MLGADSVVDLDRDGEAEAASRSASVLRLWFSTYMAVAAGVLAMMWQRESLIRNSSMARTTRSATEESERT